MDRGRRTDRPGRRQVIAAGTVGTLGALAGCLDWFEEELTFEATPATVAQSVADGQGYDHVETREFTMERTFEVAGQSRDVTTVNHSAEYEKPVDTPFGSIRAAVFAALSTPKVEVLGETFNPVGDMSTAELAERIQERYEALENLEHVDDGTVTVLNRETTRSRFRGDGDPGLGVTLTVEVHITEAVESGDDYVLCVGAFPRLLSGERSAVEAMMRGVEHDG